jgi:hypothetical protein
MSDDRSERLRQRRQESKQKAEKSEAPTSSEQSETSKPSEPDETQSVKDEFVGTYMYLPESQKQELNPTFKIISAEYEREYGEELEKNRHFYPLVVQYGLDSLDSWDASEIRERLDSLDLLDSD